MHAIFGITPLKRARQRRFARIRKNLLSINRCAPPLLIQHVPRFICESTFAPEIS